MKYLVSGFFCLLVCVHLLSCTTTHESHGVLSSDSVSADKRSPEDQERIFKQLNAAVKDGKQTVSIHLDEDPDKIQPGDIVTINIVARTEDGKLINTTLSSVANQQSQTWVRGFGPGKRFHPVDVIAGEPNEFPGINEVLIGMQKGEKRIQTIPVEKAFQAADPQKITKYPSVRRVPKHAQVKPLDFIRQYHIFPVVGNQISFNPYLNAKIVAVRPDMAILDLSRKPDDEIQQKSYGTTRVTLKDDEFIIRLTPKVGALFEVDKKKGWITEATGETFTVDFNHPMAGKSMVLQVEVLDFIKASVALQNEIIWLDDFDKGQEIAGRENKPMVLLLYADWCQWSRKLLNHVMKDPRITKFHDQFVWVKINSDKHREYMEGFEQKTFPKVVIIGPDGEIMESMEGFNNVHVVSEKLLDADAVKSTG